MMGACFVFFFFLPFLYIQQLDFQYKENVVSFVGAGSSGTAPSVAGYTAVLIHHIIES